MANHDENTTTSSPTGKKNNAVVNYIAILFGAAFLLLLMTYLMEQRQSAEALDGLRNSVSAMQSVEGLYEQNSQLVEENNKLEQEILKAQNSFADLEEEKEELEEKVALHQKTEIALDWFWQVNEAFVLGKHTLAISLIEEMEALELDDLLPLASATDNKRFSPAHRYAEIYRELFPEDDN